MNRIMAYTILTISAFAVLYLFTGLIALIILVFASLRLKSITRHLMGFWAKSVLWIMGKKLHIEGIERIKKNGKYILIANHSSLFNIEYCKLRNYNLREVFYYGDSISDLPALEVVGHPVCVTPDKKLERIAVEQGWEIRNW